MTGFPNPGQMLLLRAALARGDAAAMAWSQWEHEYRLDRPDPGSFRLLPLAYRNLSSQGYTGPGWNTLKGIHRRTWSESQVLFHQVRPLLADWHAAGVPLLLLKGAALSSLAYPDSGCRPMRDIDVLVPPDRGGEFSADLERRGWRPTHWRPRRVSPAFCRFRHGMDYQAPSGGELDLHWHALNLCCHESADALFWNSAEPIDFAGLPLRTCGATAHLLHICAHGLMWNPVSPVRWVADAVLLLRSGRPISWPDLLAAATAFDLVPYIRPALHFLSREFEAPVPASVIATLDRAGSTRAALAEYARECAPRASRTAWEDLLAFYARWHRSLGSASPLLHAPAFLLHLQYAFGLESVFHLPVELLRSTLRRLTNH